MTATKAFLYTLKFVTGVAPDGPTEWSPGVGFGFTQGTISLTPDQNDLGLVGVAALQYVDIGQPVGIGDTFQIQRARGTGIVFTPQRVTASGPTTLFTPDTGKKFVLLGATISVCAAIASAGELEINLLDGAGAFWMGNAFCNTTLGRDTQLAVDFGQGYTSVAADNELRINLGVAATDGSVAVSAWGLQV